MKLVVLPGNSPGNKEWLEYLQKNLSGYDLEMVEYPHWASGNEADFSVKKEAEKLASKVQGQQVGVLAKSVGTVIAMMLLNKHGVKFEKMILCGIPLTGFREETAAEYQQALSGFDSSKVMCVQNTRDPWGSFAEVERFVQAINPKIVVVSKESDNHAYPYAEEFNEFLSPS